MNFDIIKLCSAFQSEKTGSTPVGSATPASEFMAKALPQLAQATVVGRVQGMPDPSLRAVASQVDGNNI
jgi:hypothetical protein